MDILIRPQPIGLFPLSAAHLLLPAPDGSETRIANAALAELLRGNINTELPSCWRFFRLAIEGRTDQAIDALADQQGPLADYNRFVLAPTPDRYGHLRLQLRGPLQTMIQVVGFTLGLDDVVPVARSLDGEFLAVALATEAAAHLEDGAPFAARRALERAMEAAEPHSPLLAAVYSNQLGEIVLSLPGGSPLEALDHFRKGLRLADASPLPLLLAQLWCNMGVGYQSAAEGKRGMLLEAVRCYQAALQHGIDRAQTPELYGFVQNNLGLAYMAMPAVEASDQLRMGVAVQAFREALAVYDRDKTPQLWATTKMNLANALQYLPSSHPAENLARAVDTYDEVLQIRKRALDPVGYARVLANQGNALSHLGQFQQAMKNLAEADTLFRRHELFEEAEETSRLIEAIHRRHRELRGGQPSEETTTIHTPS